MMESSVVFANRSMNVIWNGAFVQLTAPAKRWKKIHDPNDGSALEINSTLAVGSLPSIGPNRGKLARYDMALATLLF
jgi:hypothetical protein